MNTDYRLICNGLNKKDIKGTTDALKTEINKDIKN